MENIELAMPKNIVPYWKIVLASKNMNAMRAAVYCTSAAKKIIFFQLIKKQMSFDCSTESMPMARLYF